MKRLYVLFIVALLAVATLAPVSGAVHASGGARVGSFSRVYNSGFTRLRTGPSFNYGTITTIDKGQLVYVISGPSNQIWYKVSYRGWTGYVDGDYLMNMGLAGTGIAPNYSKVVVVSLARQQLEAYQNGKLYLATAVTTGQPNLVTPTGTTYVMAKFSPYEFISPWPKGSKYYYSPSWVKYAIRFRSGGYYIHDAPWRPYYGYGTNYGHYDPDGVWRTGSHGCVNVPLWAEAILWNWMGIGTRVVVVSW